MAKRGRKPQSPLKMRSAIRVPDDLNTIPEPPDYLTDDEKLEFLRLAGKVAGLGLLSQSDPRLFELAAISYGVIGKCQQSFDVDELLFQAPNGATQANPLLNHFNQASKQYLSILNTLGLTPSGAKALGLGVSDETTGSKWKGLIKVHGEGA